MSQTKTPKFDEILRSVWDVRNNYIRKASSTKDPKIVIYIDYDYSKQILAEIVGSVSQDAYEFHEARTIIGYPTFLVVMDNNSRVMHAPWEVVLLGDKS